MVGLAITTLTVAGLARAGVDAPSGQAGRDRAELRRYLGLAQPHRLCRAGPRVIAALKAAYPAPLLWRVVGAWALICALLLLTNASAIAQLRFPDPDDTLRLIQVRDLLGGQNWFDLHQHRVDPLDGGVPMHWSRLVDVPIAAAILALRPLLGTPHAELAAMIAVPLLTLLCLLLLVGRIAWVKLGRDETGLACLVTAMSVPVITQLRPIRIDHHGWQIVAALTAANGLMARDQRRGGWLAGLALAVGLSISLEGLPLMVVFAAIGLWRWLRAARDAGWPGAWLAAMLQALAVGSLLCFATTRGVADFREHCDAISPVHLAVFTWGAVAVTALVRARGQWRWTLAGVAGTAAVAAAMLAAVAPQCARGTFDGVDPLVRRLWLDQVAEGLPIWRQDVPTALQIVLPGLFGLIAAGQLARSAPAATSRWWREYSALLAGALAIALLVARAGGVAGALGAVPLGWQLTRWLVRLRGGERMSTRVTAGLLMVVALIPAVPLTLYDLLAPSRLGPPAPGQAPGLPQRVTSCNIRAGAQILAGLPRGNILAPLDIGPELLLGTDDTVLATGHHRGAKAMREVMDAFLGSADTAHAIIARRNITFLALCPDLAEPALYTAQAPHGFMAQLLAGRAPNWLTPIAMRDGRMRLWRVVG